MSQLVEIRPGTDADVIPLCGFLNACTLVHQGVSRSAPADIVARLHLEGADPQLDSFLASPTARSSALRISGPKAPTRSSSSPVPTLTRVAAVSAAGSSHSAIAVRPSSCPARNVRRQRGLRTRPHPRCSSSRVTDRSAAS
jgi:hypothetical protein